MPRCARIKSNQGVYHVILRGQSDQGLFKDSIDKNRYLEIIKKYQQIFLFRVYAYCIMTSHAHIIIYCNGSDISKFMHNINQSYALYYNRRYSRRGHVFMERFKSKLVNNNAYLLTLSAYIHNNPKDIAKYKSNVEKYEFSSLGIYLNLCENKYSIVDISLILDQFSKNKKMASQYYFEFVRRDNIDMSQDNELTNLPSEYRSEKMYIMRNYSPEDIINITSKYLDFKSDDIKIKYKHKTSEFKAVCVFFMRMFCNLSYKQIYLFINGLSLSQISKLCSIGFNHVYNNSQYLKLMNALIKECPQAS